MINSLFVVVVNCGEIFLKFYVYGDCVIIFTIGAEENWKFFMEIELFCWYYFGIYDFNIEIIIF